MTVVTEPKIKVTITPPLPPVDHDVTVTMPLSYARELRDELGELTGRRGAYYFYCALYRALKSHK